MTNLCKVVKFVWTPEAHHAFEQLKATFTTVAVLALSDPAQAFIAEVDASTVAIGATRSEAWATAIASHLLILLLKTNPHRIKL